MIRIGIVEDDDFYREVLVRVIDSSEGLRTVASLKTGEEALMNSEIQKADVILMDLDLGKGKMNGIQCIRQLLEINSHLIIMVLTIYEDHEKVYQALSAGALGYILKSAGREKILEGINEIHLGGSPISSAIARKLVNRFNQNQSMRSMVEHLLTERENEILQLVAKGKLEKEVADQLHISIKTVKNHVTNIYKKLQVNSRVEALNKFYGRD